MNNPLAGTDPTGYCVKRTGSNICAQENKADNSLEGRITSTLQAGGSVKFEGLSSKEAGVIRSAFSAGGSLGHLGRAEPANGARSNQGSTMVGQTDGSKEGASGIGGARKLKMIKDESGQERPSAKNLRWARPPSAQN
jgi:hypothetical protein